MPLRNPYLADENDPSAPGRSPLKMLLYWLWAAWGFLQCWVLTRRLKFLLQGIPVMALGIGLSVLFLTADQPVSSETISDYTKQAEQAIREEEYERAEFYFRKLDQLAPRDRSVVRLRAQAYEERGQYGDAVRLMESLVNDEDQTNDAKIHLWLAKMAMHPDVQLDDKLNYIKAHLNAVLEEEPGNLTAQYVFSQLYLRVGDVTSAIAHLEHVEHRAPELQLLLSSLYQSQGDKERSRQNAQNAVDVLTTMIRQTQTADASVYHQLAAGQLILREFENAEQTLLQADTKFNLEVSRLQLSRVYVAWSDDVARRDPENVGSRMKLLEKALLVAPNEPLALKRMLDIASAEGPGAEEAEQRLRKALVDGVAPATVHFSLGALAAKRGDSETAMRHFRQSAQLNPRTSVTMNNIAYLMAQSEDADMDQALELINQALKMAPSAAPYRETRGQILVRLGRWSEAIADLEFANSKLTELSSRIAINRSLATAYEGLGDTRTAASYRDKMEELIAQARANQAERGSRLNAPEPPFVTPDPIDPSQPGGPPDPTD